MEVDAAFEHLLFNGSKWSLNRIEEGFLRAEVRSRGYVTDQLTRKQVVELLFTLNCALNKHPRRNEMVKKIHKAREVWHTAWRMDEEQKENQIDEDINEDIDLVETKQEENEMVCLANNIKPDQTNDSPV